MDHLLVSESCSDQYTLNRPRHGQWVKKNDLNWCVRVDCVFGNHCRCFDPGHNRFDVPWEAVEGLAQGFEPGLGPYQQSLNSSWVSLSEFDGRRRNLNQALDDASHRTPTTNRMPESLPFLVSLPVVSMTKEFVTAMEERMEKSRVCTDDTRRSTRPTVPMAIAMVDGVRPMTG